MYLQEAAKTGRPFRRKGNIVWIDFVDSFFLTVSLLDTLANDWEIKPETLTITKEQYERALKKWRPSTDYTKDMWYFMREEVLCTLKKGKQDGESHTDETKEEAGLCPPSYSGEGC